MTDETPVETPKKHKGWPKGKKRGPRVTAPPIMVRAVPRILPADDDPPPVRVIVDGEEFRCNQWAFEGGFLKLSYWPENRGRVGTRYIAVSTIKDLRVEQPREMPVAAQPAATTSALTPVTFTSPVEAAGGYTNPLMAARRERGVLPVVPVKDSTGLRPMTQVVDNEGKVEVLGATIS